MKAPSLNVDRRQLPPSESTRLDNFLVIRFRSECRIIVLVMADAEVFSTATQTAWKIIPHFPSSSIRSTVQYYAEALHFKTGDPQYIRKGHSEPTFCSVAMGLKAEANIYFFLNDDNGPQLSPGKAMIAMTAEGLEDYYELLKKEGKVKFVEDIDNKEWGYRQFEIADEDGNRLQFFRFLEG